MTPHCGRLDPHDPHGWAGTDDRRQRTTHQCPGLVITEGASMPPCSNCGEQPAAAHGFGWCRWCVADGGVAAS